MEKTKKDKKKVEAIEKVAPKTDTSKVYELGYIVIPSITEDRLRVEVSEITNIITSRGGDMISSEQPVLIDLAYQMLKVIHADRAKYDEGYFGWMKFEIETDKMAEIKKAIDETETVLRYLLIKAPRENTLVNGKMDLGQFDEDRTNKRKAGVIAPEEIIGENEEIVEINEVELDKSIDNLVIS